MRSGFVEMDEIALRNAIIDKGTTLKDVSLAIGKSQAFLSGVITRHCGVSLRDVDNIAMVLEVNTDDLVAKADTPFARTRFVDKYGNVVDNTPEGEKERAKVESLKADAERMKELKSGCVR